MIKEQISGIILAGGKSSRMGEEKGLVIFRGKHLIEYPIHLLEELGIKDRLIITSNTAYDVFAVKCVKDEVENLGPIGGIITGLLHSESPMNLILPCDVPMLRSEVLEFLIESHITGKVTVPLAGGRIHNIIGIFEKDCLAIIQEAIDLKILKLSSVIEKIGINVVNCDERFGENTEAMFANLNSRQDVSAYETGD